MSWQRIISPSNSQNVNLYNTVWLGSSRHWPKTNCQTENNICRTQCRMQKALVPSIWNLKYLSGGLLPCFEMLVITLQHVFQMPSDVKLFCLQPCATSYTTQQWPRQQKRGGWRDCSPLWAHLTPWHGSTLDLQIHTNRYKLYLQTVTLGAAQNHVTFCSLSLCQRWNCAHRKHLYKHAMFKEY